MNSIQSMDLWMFALVLTVTTLAGFGIFARWCAYSPAVPRDKLNRLAVGMTMEEVKLLLGPPRLRRGLPDDLKEWVYGVTMKRHVLMLQFGLDGKLQSFGHGVPGGHISSSAMNNE